MSSAIESTNAALVFLRSTVALVLMPIQRSKGVSRSTSIAISASSPEKASLMPSNIPLISTCREPTWLRCLCDDGAVQDVDDGVKESTGTTRHKSRRTRVLQAILLRGLGNVIPLLVLLNPPFPLIMRVFLLIIVHRENPDLIYRRFLPKDPKFQIHTEIDSQGTPYGIQKEGPPDEIERGIQGRF